MKKSLKITLIVMGVLIGIVALDTLQAIVFNNSPLISIRKEYKDGYVQYMNKGLLVNYYYCSNKEEKTVFRVTKFNCKVEDSKTDINSNNSDFQENLTNTMINEQNITWDEITADGINEELLLKNVNTENLEKVASLLQSLSTEIGEKEKDAEFYFLGKWYEYALNSSQYNEVLSMGNDAIKPLYLIIYKSPNQNLYEYICSMALEELSGFEFDKETEIWATSKQFLELFNKKVVDSREN